MILRATCSDPVVANGDRIIFGIGMFNAFFNGFHGLFLKPEDRAGGHKCHHHRWPGFAADERPEQQRIPVDVAGRAPVGTGRLVGRDGLRIMDIGRRRSRRLPVGTTTFRCGRPVAI
jgi:hypothetical protein